MSTNWALKHRPKTLDEIAGQAVNVQILKAKKADIYQTMIFYGASGCGKTTAARALANDIGSEIIEVDAASNNSVENIRQIIDLAGKMGFSKTWKMFIIDEAHMLSKAAWNALLKTVEEPPKGVVFIFCTTEYKNIPLTIRGRSQLFKFYKLERNALKEYIKTILTKENATLPEPLLDAIVYQSNQQVRDAVKFAQLCVENNIDNIKEFEKKVGIPTVGGMASFIEAVLDGKPRNAMRAVDSVAVAREGSGENMVDLVEWARRMEKVIWELFNDIYNIETMTHSITVAEKLRGIYEKHKEKKLGRLLDKLANIKDGDKAFSQFYALAAQGVE